MKEKKENKYWLSLEQWQDEKVFKELASREFMSPSEAPNDGSPVDRREFLKLMGASLALSSLSCVRRPTEKLVPYVKRPKDIIPGLPNYYTSSFYDGGEGFGLIVQTREGRPIKVEGNPDHPYNKGGMSARAHSHLLSLYDPERLKTPKQNLFNKKRSNKETIRAPYDEMDPAIAIQLKKGSVALLTDSYPSPSSTNLIKDFSRAYPTTHYVWDPNGLESLAEAKKLCFGGRSQLGNYRFDRAQMIVSLNCDFLGTFLSPTRFNKQFSQSRKPTKNMSRLVVFESLMSLTGTNADERHRMRPSEHIQVLLVLLDEILKTTRHSSSIQKELKAMQKPSALFISEEVIRKHAQQLLKFKGRSLVVSGGTSSQSEDEKSIHVLTFFINSVLKNIDSTLSFNEGYPVLDSYSHPGIPSLIRKLDRGQVKTLIIHRTNPLYSYPQADVLSEAMKRAEMVIYTGSHMDETAINSHYVIPDLHDLEKWSDWEFEKGTVSIQQPTIRPIIEGRTFEDSLILWARINKKGPSRLWRADSWYTYLKSNTQKRGLSWDTLLEQGFQKYPYLKALPVTFNNESLKRIKTSRRTKEGMELILSMTQGLKDGRLANVSWLQEFPDPVTKICWDNYLSISPKEARLRKLKQGQVVLLSSNTQELEIPIHIQPGQSDHVIGLALGYGRKGAGSIAEGVGINAYILTQISKDKKIFSGIPAQIISTKKQIPLAQVQDHHSMEGRQIVVETTLKQFLQNPASGIHRHKLFSLWSKHKYPREKWGMVIDLNSCTGCGACVIACQSENNIPVVGKKYVLEGREMHWIRIDRYYRGSEDNPESVVHQPVVCMHCDNAPCETVCPVAATVHSDEGTNDMIYNRCVGTRYCSNNCPYKVRRFNWFNYANNIPRPTHGALNPEVTVRSRGVMEKCTFCIHRVRSAQSQARLQDKKLQDGDIQTACQQSCPASAIVFGDLNNKESRVRKLFDKEQAYALLEEVNTKPAVRYLTRVRNKESISADDNKGH